MNIFIGYAGRSSETDVKPTWDGANLRYGTNLCFPVMSKISKLRRTRKPLLIYLFLVPLFLFFGMFICFKPRQTLMRRKF